MAFPTVEWTFFSFASENAWDSRGTEKESPIERISQ